MPELIQPLPGAAAPMPPVEAMPGAAPMPAPEALPEETSAPEPPDELLQIPAFQALFAGAPPAVSYQLKGQEDRPERQIAEKNATYLQDAGFATYKTLSGDRGVLYNGLYVHPDDLLQADKEGKLSQIAPDFDAVNHSVSKSGLSNPALRAGEPPATAASARSAAIAPQAGTAEAIAARVTGGSAPTPPGAANVAPASSSAQRRITQGRMANVTPKPAAYTQAPGQGALLNAIIKPVV